MRIHIEDSDARMKYLSACLAQKGYIISTPDEIGETPCCLIVPPGTKENMLHDWLKRLPGESILIGGRGDARLFQIAGYLGIRYINITDDEAFSVANAVPTAEGALMLILQHTDTTLRGMHVMIIGFGRVGKTLAMVLHPLGARLHILARNPVDRAWAYGMETYDLSHLQEQLPLCQVILNTVPARLLGLKELGMITPGGLLIELASEPYGYDGQLATQMGLNSILASSMPGKIAPKSAAQIMEDAILRIIGSDIMERA